MHSRHMRRYQHQTIGEFFRTTMSVTSPLSERLSSKRQQQLYREGLEKKGLCPGASSVGRGSVGPGDAERGTLSHLANPTPGRHTKQTQPSFGKTFQGMCILPLLRHCHTTVQCGGECLSTDKWVKKWADLHSGPPQT